MKLLIIGAGGIGSVFVAEVVKCVEHSQIDSMIDCTLADDDIVELDQISYQNFLAVDAGLNKAKVLCKRLKVFDGVEWVNSLERRIVKDNQLKGFDIIVLCVDNDVTRKRVMEYCFKYDKEFIDLRAQGRHILALPKLDTLEGNLRFVDDKDIKNYSCQDKDDLIKGYIQYGSRIVAMIGIQMLLNLLRGKSNKIINLVI